MLPMCAVARKTDSARQLRRQVSGKSRAGTAEAILLVDFMNLFDFAGARALAPRAERAARNTARLKARATATGTPCIFINDNFGDWTRSFDRLVLACVDRGGPAARIANLLQPAPGDISILKPRHSAFYGTPLEFLLEELQVASLIITGVAADSCVFATAQDAHVRKFRVRVPGDCVAGESVAIERAALRHMARTLKADVRPRGRTPRR
jgi:nicotinamidase-related amidase